MTSDEVAWMASVCGPLPDGALYDQNPLYSYKNQSHKDVSYQCLSAATVLTYFDC